MKQLCCRIPKVFVSLSVFGFVAFKMKNTEGWKLQKFYACCTAFMGYLVLLLLRNNLNNFCFNVCKVESIFDEQLVPFLLQEWWVMVMIQKAQVIYDPLFPLMVKISVTQIIFF